MSNAGSPPLTQTSSPNGDALQRQGTYSISGILGIPNQNAQNMADPNVAKRKREDQPGRNPITFIYSLINEHSFGDLYWILIIGRF